MLLLYKSYVAVEEYFRMRYIGKKVAQEMNSSESEANGHHS